MVWVAGAGSLILVVVTVAGLFDVFRYRDRIGTSQLVAWMIFIVVVPIVGLLSYVLWRISRSDTMDESIDFQEEHPVEDERRPPIQQG
jgi:heme/copper-type cytochrome/quinol oxidase subunit 2